MTTSSDKTKNKLLDSMRMSKEGAGDTTAAKPATNKPAASKPAASKPAASKPAASKPVKTAQKKKTPAKKASSSGSYSTREARASLIADTFESGQRIWPD